MEIGKLKEYSVYCTKILHSANLSSEQKFAEIFESGGIDKLYEECNIPAIDHNLYSNLGSIQTLVDVLDKKYESLMHLTTNLK